MKNAYCWRYPNQNYTCTNNWNGRLANIGWRHQADQAARRRRQDISRRHLLDSPLKEGRKVKTSDGGHSLKKEWGLVFILDYFFLKYSTTHSALAPPVQSAFFIAINISSSMTSLLTHNVVHSTRHSFWPKTNNQPFKTFLSLAFSWVKVVKNWTSFLKKKWFQNWSFQKMSIKKSVPLKSYSSTKFFFRKIRIIFDIENWLW